MKKRVLMTLMCWNISIFRLSTTKTLCTMIQNYSASGQQIFNLLPFSGKPIDLQFSGARISSDGGLLLLREVEAQVGLISSISSCISDNRSQRYIDHTVQKMVSQRAYLANLKWSRKINRKFEAEINLWIRLRHNLRFYRFISSYQGL